MRLIFELGDRRSPALASVKEAAMSVEEENRRVNVPLSAGRNKRLFLSPEKKKYQTSLES